MNIPLSDKTCNEYLNALYSENDGYIRIFQKGKNPKSFFITAKGFTSIEDANEILKTFHSPDNLYMSLAAYKSCKNGQKGNLLNVCALAVDCDYHSVPGQEDIQHSDVLHLLYNLCQDDYPLPTFIETSRNLRLIYVLKEPYRLVKGKKRQPSIKFLERIDQVLCDRLNSFQEALNGKRFCFAAEPHRLTSYVRIPGSCNKRTYGYYDFEAKKYTTEYVEKYCVDLIRIGETWDIDKLAELILPDKFDGYEEWKKKRMQKKLAASTTCYNLNDLLKRRLEDLEYLQRTGHDTGYREKMCYLYRLFSIQSGLSDEDALQKTLEFNQGFSNPLRERELITNTKPTNPGCKYSNQYLKMYLDCESLPVFESSANFDKDKRYYRKKHPVSKAQKIKKASAAAQKLRAEGKTLKEIASELNISIATASRYSKLEAA